MKKPGATAQVIDDPHPSSRHGILARGGSRPSLKGSQKVRQISSGYCFPHQARSLVLPPCKPPTVINFEFKHHHQQHGTRCRSLKSLTSYLDGQSGGGFKGRQLPEGVNPSMSVHSGMRMMMMMKDASREGRLSTGSKGEISTGGVELPRCGNVMQSSQDEQQRSSSESTNSNTPGGCDPDLIRNRPEKSPKVKGKFNSKTVANEVVVTTKKKSRSKRPVTSGNEAGAQQQPPTLAEQLRVHSPRLFFGRTNHPPTTPHPNKDKENLPPINKPNAQQNEPAQLPNEKQDGIHRSLPPESCPKCSNLSQKLKAQNQAVKTLQRQNNCLENIVTQKRNLVEQLTRQVRTLVRENQQLAKGLQKHPHEGLLSSIEAANLNANSLPTISVLDCTGSPPLESEEEQFAESDGSGGSSNTKFNDTTDWDEEKQGKRGPPRKSFSTEKLEEAEQQLANLNDKCEEIQRNYEEIKKENNEINRFLTDLLYTLNARGYESIRDHDGNMIDLYRCRGETFLELKGRDARLRIPAKRLAPQETLLKAVIGSQERIIQSLIAQLEDQQKDSMLAKRFNMETAFSGDEESRNAALEGDILTLLSLLEGACQRNPEVFQVLRDQHNFDSQVKANAGINVGNAIVEAVLDRCQKAISSTNFTPPMSPARLKKVGREPGGNRVLSAVPLRCGNAEGMVRGLPTEGEATMQLAGPGSNCSLGGSRQLPSTIKSDTGLLRSTPPATPGRVQSQREIHSRSRPSPTRGNPQQAWNVATVTRTGPGMVSSSTGVGQLHTKHASQQQQQQRANDLASNSMETRMSCGSNSNNSPISTSHHLPHVSINAADKALPYLNGDKCPYCSRQFLSTASLAEISAHLELHGHQFS